MRNIATALVCLALLILAPQHSKANEAIDPTASGAYSSRSGDYKLPAAVDPKVTPLTATELWARVWYPVGATGKRPLVVMLHGNHGTCGRPDKTGKWRIDDKLDYTNTGTCPAGYEPSPSHLGYDYIGQMLAAHGYVVVSINSNRGVNQADQTSPDPDDPLLIKRRGRLILRHIEQIGQWAANGGTPKTVGYEFKNKIDFRRVSVFGHSRGGDAIVSAYNLFNDASTGWSSSLPSGTKFVALVAIAPTDTQDPPPVVTGVPYGVLLPMCDGDLSRLDGVRVFDRSLMDSNRWVASFATWGADHDAYNSEWHNQDVFDFVTETGVHKCPGQGTKLFPLLGTSAKQQQLGRYFTMAMIRANSENPDFGQLLNPEYTLPSFLLSKVPNVRVDRGFFPGSARRLVTFDVPSKGACANKLAVFAGGGVVASCGRPPEHSSKVWIARLRWGPPADVSQDNYYARVTLNNNKPISLASYHTVEFRLAPDCKLKFTDTPQYGCAGETLQQSASTEDGSQVIWAWLGDTMGRLSGAAYIGHHTEQRQAVGFQREDGAAEPNPLYHAILSSARVPIEEFTAHPVDPAFDINNVQTVWIYMPSGSGGVFLGDIWASSFVADSIQSVGPQQVSVAPRPPRPGARLTGARDEPLATPEPLPLVAQAGPATPGSRIEGIKRRTVSTAARDGHPRRETMVEFTFTSAHPMIAGASGFEVSIAGRPAATRPSGGNKAGTMIKVTVPATAVDEAPDGAPVVLSSGGARWSFGSLNKGKMR